MNTHAIIRSYKDLLVWQRAIELAVNIYKLTNYFPKEERFGLTSQMRRAAVSIPSNIAEGRSRKTRKDFVQFLRIAHGSLAELESQIEIASQIDSTKHIDYTHVLTLIEEIGKMLNGMIKKLEIKHSNLPDS